MDNAVGDASLIIMLVHSASTFWNKKSKPSKLKEYPSAFHAMLVDCQVSPPAKSSVVDAEPSPEVVASPNEAVRQGTPAGPRRNTC